MICTIYVLLLEFQNIAETFDEYKQEKTKSSEHCMKW